MMRHGIEARQGRNRLLAGSIHESPAPKGTPRQKKKQIGDDLTVASANLDFTIKRSKKNPLPLPIVPIDEPRAR